MSLIRDLWHPQSGVNIDMPLMMARHDVASRYPVESLSHNMLAPQCAVPDSVNVSVQTYNVRANRI